jgi:hypothetical protein
VPFRFNSVCKEIYHLYTWIERVYLAWNKERAKQSEDRDEEGSDDKEVGNADTLHAAVCSVCGEFAQDSKLCYTCIN